jgi:hypothetical protein
MSLKDRFSDEKLKIFTLHNLHPKKMKLMSDQQFAESVEFICNLYGSLLDSFKSTVMIYGKRKKSNPP